ncbi:MAG: YraN family protein [Desulfobacteraceae bacterium]|nr:YraN family protein [Desulfobacteraceae bacterium]
MTKARGEKGRLGEELAARHLTVRGYRILARNFRVACGEIDIVAEDRGTLVFVEVKTRCGLEFGGPAEALTSRKQRQISRVALTYLSQRQLLSAPARFDVVTVLLAKGAEPRVELIANAFDLALPA